ncbi:MAG: hypothetical protein RI894_2599 [Bacteroidota bacterium]
MKKSQYIKNVLTLLLAICCQVAWAQDAGKTPEKGYKYPVRPGTPEWVKLQSHDEMLKVCAIPMETVRAMTTDALLATALSYPLIHDYLAYNDMLGGMTTVMARSEAWQEFVTRPDAAQKLLAEYVAMRPEAVDSKWTLVQKGDYSLTFIRLEMLLAQPAISSKLTKQEAIALLKKCNENVASMATNPEVYGYIHRCGLALVVTKTLNTAGYTAAGKAADALKTFANGFSYADEAAVNAILVQSQSFISTIQK